MDAKNPNDDDLPEIDDALPDWIWEIADKYELGVRADRPLGGVLVLLYDAIFDLRRIANKAISEEAMKSRTKQRLRSAIEMLTDAERLSAACDG